MLRSYAYSVGLIACVIAGCAGHHESPPPPENAADLDASTTPSVLDDPMLDPPSPSDGSAHDAASHDTEGEDAAKQDAAKQDVPPIVDASVEPSIIAAVPGESCAYSDLISFVRVVNDPSELDQLTVTAFVFDRPLAQGLAPVLSTERGACGFYQSPTGCAEDCRAKELVCGPQGACVPLLIDWREDARLTLSNGSATQVLDPVLGQTQLLMLDGALSVQLEFDRYVVTLGATPLPEPLAGLDVRFNGPAGAHDRVDISWAEAVDGYVYAFALLERGSPLDSFTECIADGSARSFAIDEDVIEPFVTMGVFLKDTVEHTYVAAANTPAGCIEIRYSYRYWISP